MAQKAEVEMTDNKTGQKIPIPAPQPQMSPFDALAIMSQNLNNIAQFAKVIAELHGVKIERVMESVTNIHLKVIELNNWMITELKLRPGQPMNRQQKRRMEKRLKELQKNRK